jgi:hypothetical protein
MFSSLPASNHFIGAGGYDVIISSGMVSTSTESDALFANSIGDAPARPDDYEQISQRQLISYQIMGRNLMHYEKLLGWGAGVESTRQKRALLARGKVLVVHCKFDFVMEEVIGQYARQNGINVTRHLDEAVNEAYYFMRKDMHQLGSSSGGWNPFI